MYTRLMWDEKNEMGIWADRETESYIVVCGELAWRYRTSHFAMVEMTRRSREMFDAM